MLALLVIVILVLMLMTGAPQVGAGALIFGALFVGFWILVIKMLIGFGRWLMGEPAPRRFQPVSAPPHRGPVRYMTSPRACADPRCGRVNVSEARFCAQCGRPLGPAPSGYGRAGGRAA